MPSAAYHAHFALSSSGMKHMRISPAHFKAWQGSASNETAPMRLGTLTHLLVLEPHRFQTDVAVWATGDKRGKAWDAFEAANAGKLIVKPQELLQAQGMAKAIRANPMVNSALRGGRAELEYLGTDPIFQCPVKCAFDYITPTMILDLKKTGDTVQKFIDRSIWDYDYHVQAAWYKDLALQMDGIERQYAWIVVEDRAPYACQLVVPDQDMLDVGAITYQTQLERFALCHSKGEWPGYEEQIRSASMPDWVRRKLG